MPKYEKEPGRYSTKKPEPISREKPPRQFVNSGQIDPDTVSEVKSVARERVREQWRKTRSEDLETLEACDPCLEKITVTEWQLSDDRQSIEPIYEECSEHPQLMSDWIYQQLSEMYLIIEEELE